MKTIELDKYEYKPFTLYFDMDGDGKKDKIYSRGSYHFWLDFSLELKGNTYDFSVGAAETLDGRGKLHILKSMTNGVHDIMTEQEGRTIYRWNGSTYEK